MSEQESNNQERAWVPEIVDDTPPPRTSISRVLEALLWFALIGTIAAVAIPEMASRPPRGQDALTGLVGLLLWPFLLAKVRRMARPWLYSLAGIALFFGLVMAGGAKRGLAIRSEGNDLLAAMEAFEPETGRLARGAKDDGARLRQIMQPAIVRAAQRAPDSALLAYTDAIHRLVATPEGVNRQRCASMLTGGAQVKPTREEELQLARAAASLFRAAAGHADVIAIDVERALMLRENVVRTADTAGLTADPQRMSAMTPEQACALYLGMVRAMRALPAADAALIMRLNMTVPEAS